jgi:hypothetical protein
VFEVVPQTRCGICLLAPCLLAQPAGHPKEDIDSHLWTGLLGDSNARQGPINSFSEKLWLKNLTHSVYEPLATSINELAPFLVVDRHWLPASDVRKNPEYLNKVFQHSILRFILDNRDAAERDSKAMSSR